MGIATYRRCCTRQTWLAIASILGCGGGTESNEPQFDLVPVKGVVTLDNVPLAGERVVRPGGRRPPPRYLGSGAVTDADGKFELRAGTKPGAVVGQHKVVISREVDGSGNPIVDDPESGMDIEQLRMQGQVRQSIPARYSEPQQTELQREVTGGTNEHTFEPTGS